MRKVKQNKGICVITYRVSHLETVVPATMADARPRVIVRTRIPDLVARHLSICSASDRCTCQTVDDA